MNIESLLTPASFCIFGSNFKQHMDKLLNLCMLTLPTEIVIVNAWSNCCIFCIDILTTPYAPYNALHVIYITWGAFQKTYELLNQRALNILVL